MNELSESKFIDKFINGIFSIEKVNRTSKYELKDIVKQLVSVNNTPFDAGVLFLHDQVKYTFSCQGIFSEEGEYKLTKKVIDEKLEHNECNLDEAGSSLENCGLYCFVAKSFKDGCGKDGNIYFAINDVDKFIKHDEFAQYYIDVDFCGKKVKSEYVFPVYINNEKPQGVDETCQRILHAVIVLVSFKKTNISRDELKLLSNLISYRILVEVKKVADEAFQRFINRLSCFESVSYGKDEYQKTFSLLKDLYSQKDKDDEEDTLKHCFLKHASLWTLNDTDKENKFLVKEKNLNPPEGKNEPIHLITNENIEGSSSPHYFYQFITGQIEKIKNNPQTIQFRDLVEVSRFKKVNQQFHEKEGFKTTYNIMDDDIVILFPVIPHLEKPIKNKNNEYLIKDIGLMVLYFDRNTFSYYYNQTFLEIMSHKTYENIKIAVSKARRDIRKSISDNVSDLFKKEEDFYTKAAEVIKEKLDFEACLIYLFTEERKGLELKDFNKNGLFPNFVNCSERDACNFFPNFANQEEVSEKLAKYIEKVEKNLYENEPFIWCCHQNLHTLDNKENFLYSLMVMALKDSGNKSIGVLICLNNKRNINADSKSERSFFSSKDYEISSIGAETIGITTVIYQEATRLGKILKRSAHEIPALSSFIMQNIEEIKDNLENPAVRIEASRYKHISNMLNQQAQAVYRMMLYSQYARLKSINEINLAVEKEELNMRDFLASIINMFRSDAQKYGVFVEYNIVSHHRQLNVQSIPVHPLFRLAIWNLINNAIQYSYFGTNILITVENDLNYFYIHVENIGIALNKEVEDKIFDENFRSKEARIKFFKGTGLGLTFAHQIVQAHDGKILLQTDNNFCDRNIFGIFEIENILKEMKSDKDREKFINRKSSRKRSYDEFKKEKEMDLSPKEISILEEYRDFKICKSDRSEFNQSKNYLEKIFKGNENLDILFRKQIKHPLSYVKFTIQLDRRKI
jgi:hypothetical protein